jgi:hypothetical protein
MVRAAFRAAGVGWWRLAVEDRGDGTIVLVLPTVSKVDLLDPMIPGLAAALRDYNMATEPACRMRLRVSVHAGEIHRDARGWVGGRPAVRRTGTVMTRATPRPGVRGRLF